MAAEPGDPPEPRWEPARAVPNLPQVPGLTEGMWGSSAPTVAFLGLCPRNRQTRTQYGGTRESWRRRGELGGLRWLPIPQASCAALPGTQQCRVALPRASPETCGRAWGSAASLPALLTAAGWPLASTPLQAHNLPLESKLLGRLPREVRGGSWRDVHVAG